MSADFTTPILLVFYSIKRCLRRKGVRFYFLVGILSEFDPPRVDSWLRVVSSRGLRLQPYTLRPGIVLW